MKKISIVVLVLFAGSAYGSYRAGAYLSPVTVYAEKEVKVEVESPSPVLERIAQCESGRIHYKDGQILIHANSNKTVDVGYFQINSVWFKKATELGYDLTHEEENKKFALWLYKNHGTQPWEASKDCWDK